jgi:hypothetical protein
VLDALAAPLDRELRDALLHLERHAQARARVLGLALALRVAEEDQDRVADELVDRAAVLQRDRRHLGEVLVEIRVICSGCSRSVVAVKSLMSEKKIVSFLRSVSMTTSRWPLKMLL